MPLPDSSLSTSFLPPPFKHLLSLAVFSIPICFGGGRCCCASFPVPLSSPGVFSCSPSSRSGLCLALIPTIGKQRGACSASPPLFLATSSVADSQVPKKALPFPLQERLSSALSRTGAAELQAPAPRTKLSHGGILSRSVHGQLTVRHNSSRFSEVRGEKAWSAMERESRSGVLSETGSCAGTPRSVQSSRSLQHRYSSRSILKTHEGAPDMSPRFSYCKPTTHREKMINRRHSLNLPEQLPDHCSRKATERTQKATSKSVADLVGEIAALEQEVIRKELHLLSLYRRAFDQYVSESCSFTSEQVDQETLKNIDEGALRLRDIKQSAAFNLPTVSNSEVPKSGARHSSLVNFLSASISEYVPKISCKLSEDILSCIGAVYCKLSSTQRQDAECMTSPSPSVSSSSTFSPRRRNDSWSPRFNFDSPRQYGFQKEKNEQNIDMIVIPRIHIDADKFDYASKMLETIRSLIQRLEKVDPMKMTHEEQLCFWINIHNALVMHAFLAYGLHDKRMKSTDMILKAAYNVGGQSVNAQIIQNSILGCQSHRPSLWVRALFTPSKRSTAGTARHPYTLHHPEPIAHFALSTGAFSDPPVRLYTAKKIHQQLEAARTEFIQGSVVVRKQALLLPKVLHYYARDAALELRHLVELVCESMPEDQRERCPRRRADKCVEWMPYKSSFRYVVHRDLAD